MKNCMRPFVIVNWRLTTFLLLLFFLCAVGPVSAMQFQLGPDAQLDLDVQLKYTAAWRLDDPDPELQTNKGNAGWTLGNRNFEKGDMINNKFSTTVDIDLQYKNMGIFVRPRAYYDFVYDEDKPFPYPEETLDQHRDKAEILDAFAYAEFDLGEMPMSVRVGRQVVSWGESLFIPFGISSAQNHVDATMANTPGTELKDIFLPTAQVFVKADLPAGFSLAGYYKFEWEPTRFDEVGSYFSFFDLVLEAGIDVPLGPLGTINQLDPGEASDDGQYGFALRYFADALNGTEFGAYYLNYHENFPMATTYPTGGTNEGGIFFVPVAPGLVLPVGPDAWSYQGTFQEDVKLYGFSVSAELFGWNIAPEISYRTDYPIRVAADPVTEPWHFLGFKYELADFMQVQCSFLKLLPGSPLWEGMTLLGEVAFMKVYNNETEVASTTDEEAWQYVIQVAPNWTNVLIDGLDLEVPINWSGAPSGSGNPLGAVVEQDQRLGIRFNFTYNQKYQVGLGYTHYVGSPYHNDYADRDYVSFDLKYTF